MNAKQGDFKGPLDLIKFTASQGPMAFFKGMYFLIVLYTAVGQKWKNSAINNVFTTEARASGLLNPIFFYKKTDPKGQIRVQKLVDRCCQILP